jgi:hypothetical protein
MLPKKGRIFPRREDRRADAVNYATAISSALRQELGQSHRATKTVMRWTGASERTVKNWLAGASGPRGEHLLALIRRSDVVFEAFLGAAGRESLVTSAGSSGIREALVEIHSIIESLLERTPE